MPKSTPPIREVTVTYLTRHMPMTASYLRTLPGLATCLLLALALSACDSLAPGAEAPERLKTVPKAAVLAQGPPSAGAQVNVLGCQNDDGAIGIILPDGRLIEDVPIISSNCVLEAGPTEHLVVHSELPEGVSAPDRPIVWNYENTGYSCWANQNDPKYTTDWKQRITPSGRVHLVCHFNAKKSDDR